MYQMSETTIAPVHTACLGCIWAIKEDNTQIGCRFGLTDRVETVEAYNEYGEFYILNGVKCVFKKTTGPNNLTDEQAKRAVLPTYHLYLNTNKSIESLTSLVQRINRLKYKPEQLILMAHKEKYFNEPYILSNLLKEHYHGKWSIENCINKDIDEVDHRRIAVNKKSSKTGFLVFMHEMVDNELDQIFDSYLENPFRPFSRIHSFGLDVVPTYTYKNIGDYAGSTYFERLQKITKEQNKPHHIIGLSEWINK